MTDLLVDVLKSVPPPLATVLLAMVPVSELRGALPVALLVYKMSLPAAIFFSIIGNMIPVYFLFVFFEKTSKWLAERSALARRFLDWLLKRTRRKLTARVEKYGYWALTMFVAIPLPVTGTWTGTLAAFVFGLPKKKSSLAMLIGLCISSAIVTAITIGGNAAVLKILIM